MATSRVKTKTKTAAKAKTANGKAAANGAVLSYRLRSSPVHGKGLFATRRIPKGRRIIEYVGEHITHEEADRRYAEKHEHDNHTFLFTVDEDLVIDGGVDGNDARFINHSCDPNCEVVDVGRRLYVKSERTIEPGEELAYDYYLTRGPDDPPNVEQVYGCRCGTAKCRGTMLAPIRKKKPAAAKKPPAKAKRRPR